MTLCFKANGKPDLATIPDWLSVEFSFAAKEPRFYSVCVLPEIADVALVLGTLEHDGTPAGWIAHLQDLGFEDVVQVSCNEFFGVRGDRDR
ncbi:hypothetical protein [Gloeocapsopsis dulcis]|uniref:Uncharacterized protein n=1 Tax=Gloeocapsopsis dulcis AAB1 = 1H9 TaxID=1433147 RepID=A0A6N8G1U9_9CHRO|nr:hypothetical protein [Gloeocapsopsis dulcis]MUL38146.1 hypothetical protein [Gloeocapsopsis dulcis AAB1 = 1H9]WNN89408.1 hypothetical protein P0S91_24780 [Gloeocapsopsis dulcis]